LGGETLSLYPFPALIGFEAFNGDWGKYESFLYQNFLDNIVKKLSFAGQPISCKYFEPISGFHRTFWHLITENLTNSKIDEDRTPDFRRCERLHWIPHIFENINDNGVSCWISKRKGETKIVIWIEAEDYMIVLTKRKEYYLLTSAYQHRMQKRAELIRERQSGIDPRK
jgi:hypothetical protein